MPDAASLQLVGISHHHADLAARTLAATALERLAAEARRLGVPHLHLATCNRVELYWLGALPLDPVRPATASGTLRHVDGMAALRHLIAVASGRESMILGEGEILGQVRHAWAQALDQEASGAPLDALVRRALAAARRIRKAAPLAGHARSVADAAIAAARRRAVVPPRRFLVLGAGEAAAGAVRAILTGDPRAVVTVIARRQERAAALAASHGQRWRGWERLADAVARNEVIVAATGARTPVLTPADCAGTAPRVFVDLGAPRNIDPAVAALPGATLLDLDGLREAMCPMTQLAAETRLAEVDALIDAEAVAIGRAAERGLAPVLRRLHAEGERLAAHEAEMLIAELGATDPAEQERIRAAVRRTVRRALFPVGRALRRHAAR